MELIEIRISNFRNWILEVRILEVRNKKNKILEI